MSRGAAAVNFGNLTNLSFSHERVWARVDVRAAYHHRRAAGAAHSAHDAAAAVRLPQVFAMVQRSCVRVAHAFVHAQLL